MKIIEIDKMVFAFYDDGTVWRYDNWRGEWWKVTGPPGSPENEAKGEKLSEYKGE